MRHSGRQVATNLTREAGGTEAGGVRRSGLGSAALLSAGLLAGALGTPVPVAGQTISGTVREAGGGPLLSGAFLSLLDASGSAVRSDFTAADGIFSLRAPRPGEYRIQVERIGYANWITEPYALGARDRLAVTVEVPPDPIRLADITVEGTRSCIDDPSQGRALATVWDEARKALASAVWAEERGEVTFTLVEFERTLDPDHLTVLETTSRTRRHVRLPPFESVPPERLLNSGYAVITPDSSVYFAPDASLLLSVEFRELYCFGLRRDEFAGESMLGITFRPASARDVVDIEGTLWVTEESAALHSVDLQYRGVPLPRNAERRHVGAHLAFDRLPDGGPFYVRDWWLRFPVPGRTRRLGRVGLSQGPQAVLVAYLQTGGTVRDAFVAGRSFEAGEGTVAGVLRDSVGGGPVAGADVIVRDWDDAAAFLPRPDPSRAPFAAVTDSAGAFTVEGLPDGMYAVGVEDPVLRTAGLRLPERRVEVQNRASPPQALWLPSAQTLRARLCPARAASAGSDAPTGSGMAAGAGVPAGAGDQAGTGVAAGQGGPTGAGDRAGAGMAAGESGPAGEGEQWGIVIGTVRDGATGVPLADVEVKASWQARPLLSAGRLVPAQSRPLGAAGASDSRGRFVVCGVPLGETVSLRWSTADPPDDDEPPSGGDMATGGDAQISVGITAPLVIQDIVVRR